MLCFHNLQIGTLVGDARFKGLDLWMGILEAQVNPSNLLCVHPLPLSLGEADESLIAAPPFKM